MAPDPVSSTVPTVKGPSARPLGIMIVFRAVVLRRLYIHFSTFDLWHATNLRFRFSLSNGWHAA